MPSNLKNSPGLRLFSGWLCMVVVLVCGLGFGSIPARRASLLPPIEALLAR